MIIYFFLWNPYSKQIALSTCSKNNNLTQNDTIELQTRRGKITVKVRKDRMIPDGLVFMPFCFEKAPVNLLTNQALDPDGKIPELKYCAAKISKINV